MVEIEELALSKPIAGVRLNIALLAQSSALLSRVSYHSWSSISKLLDCFCHWTTTAFFKAGHKHSASRIRSMLKLPNI